MLKMYKIRVIVVFLMNVPLCSLVELDLVDCGIDNDVTVATGDVEIGLYPWIGILYYTYNGDVGETRAVTTVLLIHKEFVVAVAADIGRMPKRDFRKNSRVLLGEPWNRQGRRVRNYVLHPEYGETLNTVALVQLKDPVRHKEIKPLCAPPELLRDPIFYVMKFKSDYNELQKQVIPVSHVPADLCKEFYILANLYSKKLRPRVVACAVSLDDDAPCVWRAGSALVTRDVWGRWLILGLGVRGPGCGAPSRYLDMGSYFPWIQQSLAEFNQITISKINKQKYVLRGGSASFQRYGACDEEEKVNLLFRELIRLETDNMQFQFMTYNMTMHENVEYTCLTLELVNASAVSEMRISHLCPRRIDNGPCHYYKGSKFDISVFIMFSDTCLFEMYTWGFTKDMTLLDPQYWKWEEGTYYEDFSLTRPEYRGPTYQTGFGFEPLDDKVWVPEYDIWTTSSTSTTSTTTSPTTQKATTETTTKLVTNTTRTKRYRRLRTRTTTSTTTKPSTVSTTTIAN